MLTTNTGRATCYFLQGRRKTRESPGKRKPPSLSTRGFWMKPLAVTYSHMA